MGETRECQELSKLIEFATRVADDLCKGCLTVVKLGDGWRAWFGKESPPSMIEGAFTLEEALDQALRKLLKVTISNLEVMLNMLEFSNSDPDLDDDAGGQGE